MRSFSTLSVLVLAVALTGCYHARIDTGAPASNVTLEQNWATGFIAGLVPPPEVNTAERCPNGVSRVETQISFLNSIVSMLTFNLYSPMTIHVTCAAPGAAMAPDLNVDINIAQGSNLEQVQAAFAAAGDRAIATRSPVYVQFD